MITVWQRAIFSKWWIKKHIKMHLNRLKCIAVLSLWNTTFEIVLNSFPSQYVLSFPCWTCEYNSDYSSLEYHYRSLFRMFCLKRLEVQGKDFQVQFPAWDISDRSDTKIWIFRISYPDCSKYCDVNLNSALYNKGLEPIINLFSPNQEGIIQWSSRMRKVRSVERSNFCRLSKRSVMDTNN